MNLSVAKKKVATTTVEVGITAEAPIIQKDAQVSHTFEMD